MINKIKKLSLLFISIFLVIISSFNVFALSHRDWSGDANDAYIIINNNIPNFTEDEKNSTKSFEYYGELDNLGRCTVTFANIGKDLMPKDGEKRGKIDSVIPTGWKYNKKSNNKKYSIVSGGYIYNRAHLIGWQLTGENANKKNLITGTRWMNVISQLPFENDCAKYIKKTGNHVLYRVTPIFEGDNLVVEGVQMEGWSVEDEGEGICFNIFCPNIQPGITISYKTGENWLEENAPDNIKYDDPFYKEENTQNNKSEDKEIVIDEITIEEDEEEIGPGVTNNSSTKKSTNKKNNTSTKKSSSKTVKNTTSSSSLSGKSNEAFAILLIIFFFYWLFRNRGGSSGGSSSSISSENNTRTRSSRRSKKY